MIDKMAKISIGSLKMATSFCARRSLYNDYYLGTQDLHEQKQNNNYLNCFDEIICLPSTSNLHGVNRS
jgi:hypothetical protein